MIATLVEPWIPPLASLNRTKIRDEAGLSGIAPVDWTNIENVGVAPGAKFSETVLEGGARHWPLLGSDWQRLKVTGRVADPVSADTVICPAAPALSLATAKAPAAPLAISTMPSLVGGIFSAIVVFVIWLLLFGTGSVPVLLLGLLLSAALGAWIRLADL